MAQTNKEKQARLKAKRLELGLKEMRYIWVTPEEEAIIKPLVKAKLNEMRGSV
jgi:hypothetical protein